MLTPVQLNQKRLHHLTQLLKAKIFAHLSPTTRDDINAQLHDLDEKYTNNHISLEEYKFSSLTLLTKYWDQIRVEQFLYWHAGTFLSQAEKLAITNFSPQKLQD